MHARATFGVGARIAFVLGMADERFSLRESQLDLPRLDALAERARESWIAARKRMDPSPRAEVAKTFFRDALRARIRH